MTNEFGRVTVLNITDSDLDGRSCGIVSRVAFSNSAGVDVIHTNPMKVDTVVSDLIDSGKLGDYDYVFLTDLSISEELAEKIQILMPSPTIKHFQVLDHHKTALGLNKYPWCTVNVTHKNGQLACGASLLLEHLEYEYQYHPCDNMRHYVETVRQYDTWDWYNVTKNREAKNLNALMGIIGGDDFDKKAIEYASDMTKHLINSTDRVVLNLEENRINTYIRKLESSLMVVAVPGDEGYRAGVVVCEQYQSEAGNRLAELRTDVDMIALVDIRAKKVSLRTVKGDVDVSVIAKRYGGGGHPKAAGFPLTDKMYIALGVHLFN